GGTTLVEASRCGARVVGFDIDPVAASITRFELSAQARTEDVAAAWAYVQPLAEQVRSFHQTEHAGQTVEVLHHFWVEETDCPAAGHTCELHPHYHLACDRKKGVQWAFCRHTYEVQERPLARVELRARDGRRTKIHEGTLVKGKALCPRCTHARKLGEANAERPPRWRLFAQEVLVPDAADRSGFRRVFKPATE